VVAKVRERPAVNEQRFNMERFNLKKLNDVEVKATDAGVPGSIPRHYKKKR
jgi:hypothetical protein